MLAMSKTRICQASAMPQAAARRVPEGWKATAEQPPEVPGRVQYKAFGSRHACRTRTSWNFRPPFELPSCNSEWYAIHLHPIRLQCHDLQSKGTTPSPVLAAASDMDRSIGKTPPDSSDPDWTSASAPAYGFTADFCMQYLGRLCSQSIFTSPTGNCRHQDSAGAFDVQGRIELALLPMTLMQGWVVGGSCGKGAYSNTCDNLVPENVAEGCRYALQPANMH